MHIKYRVIEARVLQSLSEAITEYLNEGWECVGGVSAVRVEGNHPGLAVQLEYLQAIQKREETNEETYL